MPQNRPTEYRRLPMPNTEEVEAFRRLYAEKFSVQLEPSEALDLARHYLHMYLIVTS